MKYELISLSVKIQGKIFRKKNNPTLDDRDFKLGTLDSAYKEGFLKPKGSKARNPFEAKAQYITDLQKQDKKEKAEAKTKEAVINTTKAETKEKAEAKIDK